MPEPLRLQRGRVRLLLPRLGDGRLSPSSHILQKAAAPARVSEVHDAGMPREQNAGAGNVPMQWSTPHVATVLDKELKRQVTVDGMDYTVAVGPEGIRLTGKGKRKPEVELRWRDLLSGEAALAVALNASLSSKRQPATSPETEPMPGPRRQPAKKGRARE